MGCNCNKGSSNNSLVVPTPSNIKKGVVAIIKTRLGIGMVDSATRSARLEICQSCQDYNKFGQCNICACLVSEKTYRKEEKCPVDKWV